MKLLVLGCKGQLGRCLSDQLVSAEHEVVFTSRTEIDILDFQTTKEKFFEVAPDLVINATAYTAVDQAEEDQEIADSINHLAVSNIAEICNEADIWLVHISTDYVFDGMSNNPYNEKDPVSPQSIYGLSKLNGELAIQSSGCSYLIFRTAWVFSEYGNNFLKTMLNLGAERDELSIVGDQIGCPTYAQDIAKAIVVAVANLNLKKSNCSVYHYCGDQSCSWYEFAIAIFQQARNFGFTTPNSVYAIDTIDYPTPASRPRFSVLNCSKIETTFGIRPSNWSRGITEILEIMSS